MMRIGARGISWYIRETRIVSTSLVNRLKAIQIKERKSHHPALYQPLLRSEIPVSLRNSPCPTRLPMCALCSMYPCSQRAVRDIGYLPWYPCSQGRDKDMQYNGRCRYKSKERTKVLRDHHREEMPPAGFILGGDEAIGIKIKSRWGN